MFSVWVLFLLIFCYMFLLFLVAYYAEKKERKGRSIASNPYVYSLSLAVYCTSWTFYGSVGKAANEGLSFLTIYIGPTLMATLWWIILRKIIYIAKENRITNIADFIAFRYGKSLSLSSLVTAVAVIGITPYLGLQIKAIMTTFSILAGKPQGSHFAGWFITLTLGIFAVIFGARRLDASERHGGLVFAVAFESAIKLFAFLCVGFFVTYGIFHGYDDIVNRIKDLGYMHLLRVGENSSVSYMQWFSLTFLSMMAILFLPRQFHVAVVENSSIDHLKKAMWLFPLYLFLINIFVIPIALGGLIINNSPKGADYFVLTIPLKKGYPHLGLLAFLGGFSAATAMVIVESLALSNMVMNSLVMPTLLRFKHKKGFHQIILNIKRLIIIGLVFCGYIFAISIGEFYSLVDIGLKSFEAVTIFAPALLLGLYWKGATKKGAIAGIITGFSIWIYTLLIPALSRAGIIEPTGLLSNIFHSGIFNPTALFGLKGLDRWSHSLFWGLSLNLFVFVLISLITKPSEKEAEQAIIFVDSLAPSSFPAPASVRDINEIESVLSQFLGPQEARSVIGSFLERYNLSRDRLSTASLIELRHEAERILSGVLGPSISTLIFQDITVLTPEEKAKISESIREISYNLQLSRKELAELNRQLVRLKEFSENIIESIPLGVATLDENLIVTYWNASMERITGIKKDEALGSEADLLLRCLAPTIFNDGFKEGEFTCKNKMGVDRILKGHLSRLTGSQSGYVLVFEDITEKKKIEEELFMATKHASIGRLAAGVAHEIGNPLASISSLVQELMTEELTPFMEESLYTINQHIERIARIVKNLVDFARLYPHKKIQKDLKEIIENTINLIKYDKNFKKIKIETLLEKTPQIKMDPDKLQQVMLNLFLNARDAMPDGGKISISLKAVNNSIELVFADTGCGIDDDMKDKIFDPFFTTKSPSRGTGLGLSICYSIIKDHGGSIKIDSEKGKGTKFIIKLPIEE